MEQARPECVVRSSCPSPGPLRPSPRGRFRGSGTAGGQAVRVGPGKAGQHERGRHQAEVAERDVAVPPSL